MSKPFGGIADLSDTPLDLRSAVGITTEDTLANVHSLVLRAGTANSGNVFIGGSQVSGTTDTWMVLEAGDGLGFDLAIGNFVDLRNIYAVTDDAAGSTSADTLFIFGLQ